tara:strand:- start:94 stop:1053 length:960 start_codon:yes stop_codon:yes gene_type:complete
MNFIVYEATFLRYFIPLIIEGNKRGIKSTIFVPAANAVHQKYTHPYKYKDEVTKLSDIYNFQIKNINDIVQHSGVTFLVEGVGLDRVLDKKYKKIILTYMVDYIHHYKKYIEKVDYVVFPSKFFAENYGCFSSKNLYFGSPKYDLVLSEKAIKEKYNLTNQKKALVIFPKLRDLRTDELLSIYKTLSGMGFEILVKTRGKDPTPHELRGDRYFVDNSWCPHTTMELIKVSDIIINFSSTTIKETILMNKPMVNFSWKPFKHLNFLYEYDFCKEGSAEGLEKSINYLINADLKNEYNRAIAKYLFPTGSSKRIMEFACNL